jgi:hypothetical protein
MAGPRKPHPMTPDHQGTCRMCLHAVRLRATWHVDRALFALCAACLQRSLDTLHAFEARMQEEDHGQRLDAQIPRRAGAAAAAG